MKLEFNIPELREVLKAFNTLTGIRIAVFDKDFSEILSYPETRALLPEAAKKNYVYHIPVDEKDACGVRRKCERNMARFGAELPNVSLLEAYPSQILL